MREQERDLDLVILSGQGLIKIDGRDFERVVLLVRGVVAGGLGGQDSLFSMYYPNGMFM